MSQSLLDRVLYGQAAYSKLLNFIREKSKLFFPREESHAIETSQKICIRNIQKFIGKLSLQTVLQINEAKIFKKIKANKKNPSIFHHSSVLLEIF